MAVVILVVDGKSWGLDAVLLTSQSEEEEQEDEESKRVQTKIKKG